MVHAAAGKAGVTAPDTGSRNGRPGPPPYGAGIEKRVRDGPIGCS
ncbi:hypothetical protein HMPREF0372_04096 [Flavonifractor plautii ATCC 29863]|uniref:Uncharacterized protein n=1 Tax=Flavonifractor plautii ATCC 29863 TaxID=411475 RepID=G9YX28_FLAPL|nr:hypothetical protein HMPREF0372_04096 [Flavonifractor plautii ATCC 29863]